MISAAEEHRPEMHDTASRVSASALRLFREKGYAGASIREIAAGADVALATMFHYFSNKAAILEHIMHRIVDELRAELDEAVDPTASAAEQLDAFVRVLVVAHCQRSDDSFVALSELRNLTADASVEVRAKRLEIQHMLERIVEAGVDEGTFNARSPHTAALAVLTMCTSVATWFRPGGPMTPEKLAETYALYARAIVTTGRLTLA
jgi:AcrR family transcriptional regulator